LWPMYFTAKSNRPSAVRLTSPLDIGIATNWQPLPQSKDMFAPEQQVSLFESNLEKSSKIGFCTLTADMAAPDDVLKDTFEQLIKDCRRTAGIEPHLPRGPSREQRSSITEADMKAWSESRVLGYFDLRLASEIANEPLTDAEYSAILFGDDDPRENPLKTTKKHYDQLTDPAYHRLLFHQLVPRDALRQ
jgi:hypothetical protein